MKFKLIKVFVPGSNKRTYSRQELCSLEVQAEFIAAVERCLGLVYAEAQTDAGEVCFANSAELRPEYRITFGKADLVRYIQAQLPGSDIDLDEDEVTFPENLGGFWEV